MAPCWRLCKGVGWGCMPDGYEGLGLSDSPFMHLLKRVKVARFLASSVHCTAGIPAPQLDSSVMTLLDGLVLEEERTVRPCFVLPVLYRLHQVLHFVLPVLYRLHQVLHTLHYITLQWLTESTL